MQVTPLGAAGFCLDTTTIRLGDLVFLRGAVSPAVLLATIGPDSIVLQFPITCTETLLINGRPMPACGFGLYAPGARLVRANTQAATYALLTTTPQAAAANLAPAMAILAAQPDGGALLAAEPTDWHRMARLVAAAGDMARDAPGVFATEPPRLALRAALFGVARRLMEGALPASEDHRPSTPQGWRRIVMGAEEYLGNHLDRPIYTDELCQVLGVSAASMADAFRATLTISPHRYLKLRRLNMVRAALLRRDGPVPLVKSVALSHGFWHLGQFAHDYRELFGETPSETLARAHGAEADTAAAVPPEAAPEEVTAPPRAARTG